ncbi:MAG: hypothetical protein WDO73_01105 [Ignavibacteriota bacterium]
MYHKKLLKYLLVVLALALWASTAYGQITSVTTTPATTFNLSGYTQFTGTAPANLTTGLVVNAAGSTTYTTKLSGVSPLGWLLAASNAGCDGLPASSAPCALAISIPKLDAMAAGTATATMDFYDVADASQSSSVGSVTINLVVTAGTPTLAVTGGSQIVDLGTYTQQGASPGSQAVTITSNDDSSPAPTYNYTWAASCSWLSITPSTAGGANQGKALTPSGTLTFDVVRSAGGANNASAVGSQSCPVVISNASGAALATATVKLNIVPGVAAGAIAGPLVYQKSSDPAIPPFVTSAITATDGSTGVVGYSAALSGVAGCTSFAIVSGATGTAPATVKIAPIEATADSAAVANNACTLTVTNTSSAQTPAPAQNFNANITAATNFTNVGNTVALTYTFNTGTAISGNWTPLATIANTVYTATVQESNPWLTITNTGTLTASSSSGTQVNFSVSPAVADLLGYNATPYTEHIILTAGGVTGTITVTLAISKGASTFVTPAVNFLWTAPSGANPAAQTTTIHR